jgi:hypothetical protein
MFRNQILVMLQGQNYAVHVAHASLLEVWKASTLSPIPLHTFMDHPLYLKTAEVIMNFLQEQTLDKPHWTARTNQLHSFSQTSSFVHF